MDRIGIAEEPEEIARCFAVMHELRPHLAAETFVARIQGQMAQGYRVAYLEHEGEIVALAGFRIFEVLWSNRTLYVDDLVTAAAQRSKGFGKATLDWLQQHAREQGCETFSLDSGTQRWEAHAFYFRERMRVTSFHFSKKL